MNLKKKQGFFTKPLKMLKNKKVFVELVNNTDWEQMSKKKLSTRFIEEFAEYLDWNELVQHNQFEEDFIIKHEQKFQLDIVARYQHLSERFIRDHSSDEKFLKEALSHQCYSVDFAREFIKPFTEYLHERFFIQNTLPNERTFEEFRDYINWWYLNKSSKLTEHFIEKYFQKFNFSSADIEFYKINREHYDAIREGGWKKKDRTYGAIACGSGLVYNPNTVGLFVDPKYTLVKKEDVEDLDIEKIDIDKWK